MRRDYDQVDVSLLCGGDNFFARHTATKLEAAIWVALFYLFADRFERFLKIHAFI